MEMRLYGFVPFAFDTSYNSFPSGHALTITCVAVVMCCVWPLLWPLWFAIALILGLTRALLTAHFLSDVFIGAGIGMIAAREIILHFFPALPPHWF
jgi:membrane-associated phospholipid phosphatase